MGIISVLHLALRRRVIGGLYFFAFLPVMSLAFNDVSSAERLVMDAQAALSSHDYRTALQRYKQAADLGNPIAMFQVGAMHESGQGVAVDLAEAAKWYERAANAGSVAGMKRLANMYLDGQAVEKNFEKAAALYSRAGESGDSNSLFLLGQLYWRGDGGQRRPLDAVKAFERAARLGDAHAMNALGIAYQLGDGVGQSNARAYAYFGLATEYGDRASTHNAEKLKKAMSPSEITEAQQLAGEMRRDIASKNGD